MRKGHLMKNPNLLTNDISYKNNTSMIAPMATPPANASRLFTCSKTNFLLITDRLLNSLFLHLDALSLYEME